MNRVPPAGLLNFDVLAAFCASVLFVVGYSLIAPWWRYAVGRTVVSLDAAIALTLLPAVLRRWFHVPVTGVFFEWYDSTSLLVVAGITLWRLWTIYRFQKSARDNPGDEEQ